MLGQLQDEVSDWSMQNAALQEELQTVKEESRKEIREMRDEFSKESAVIHLVFRNDFHFL